MITRDKVTEIFCIINEFCKVFSFMAENKPQKKREKIWRNEKDMLTL